MSLHQFLVLHYSSSLACRPPPMSPFCRHEHRFPRIAIPVLPLLWYISFFSGLVILLVFLLFLPLPLPSFCQKIPTNRVPLLRESYLTSLLLRTPLPSHLRFLFLVYLIIEPTTPRYFSLGRGELLQLFICPYHHAITIAPPKWFSCIIRVSTAHVAFTKSW